MSSKLGPPERLPLGDLPSARRSLARIIRSAYRGEIEDGKARMLGYLIGQLLGFFKAEKEIEIEARLAALEELAAKEKPAAWAEGKRA